MAKIKTIEEFANIIKITLESRYKNHEITVQDSVKNNDLILKSVVIKSENSNIGKVIHLNNYYSVYEQQSISYLGTQSRG